MAAWWKRMGSAIAIAAILAGSACGSSSTVTVEDDPGLEAQFEQVLVTGETRTLGEITDAADFGGEIWDRMYYFKVPLLMSELNRMLDTPGATWRNLPRQDAEGLIVFMAGAEVVRAIVDREPPLSLTGFATSTSSVAPDDHGGVRRVAVESMGR